MRTSPPRPPRSPSTCRLTRAVAALALAFTGAVATGPAHADTGCSAWMDRSLPAGERADRLLARMTLDDKTGMMHAVQDSTHDREILAIPDLDALQNGVLKKDWSYGGFVVSDFSSCHDTVRCATGGLDLELPNGAHYGDPLKQAVQSGQVPMATVDEHVRRILTTMFRFGLFDRPQTTRPIDAKRDGAVARAAAEAATVLLKNDDGVLPLRKKNSVALIGPGAGRAIPTGGGSSGVAPIYTVSPKEAFEKRGVKVEYAEGRPPVDLGPQPALPSYAVASESGAHGWTARYYDNATWSGDPKLTRVDPWIDADPSGGIPAPGLPPNGWSVRWSGTFTAPVDGDYALNLTNHGHATLYLDGKSVLDDPGGFPGVTKSTTLHLTGGRPHEIRVDWAKPTGQAMIELSWAPPANTPDVQIAEAVSAAKRADTAVVFVANKDSEAADRTGLALPGYQDKLVEAVAAANPRTVVVLDTGGPVLMPWAGQVAGLVQAWYPGEEDGNAAADVLLGDADPSGRLPITFPRSLGDTPAGTPEQYPGVGGVATYSEGLRVGYRHYDEKNIAPLFAFGHGLSYTTFAYRHLTVERHGGDVTVGADLTNTGRRTGVAVPQLYVGAPDEPPAQLKGFTKVELRPGRTRQVRFTLPARAFASWDAASHGWTLAGGTYHLMLGEGSRDFRLRADVTLPHEAVVR